MTRRTFLRVLGSTALAAALPTLPVPIRESPSTFTPYSGPGGALTYEMLEQAYRAACVGREFPTVYIISASMARRYGLIYDVDVDDTPEAA